MQTAEDFWPEVFLTGELKSRNKALACADGLMGWGNCAAGREIPKTFGKGMAEIGKLLDIIPLPENLSEYAYERGLLKRGQPSSEASASAPVSTSLKS